MKRFAPLVLITLAVAACGSGDDVTVDDAWSRASAPGQTSGAIYFDLTVPEDDTLVGVAVPASVAAGAEIHEVLMAEEMSEEMSDDMAGEMSDEMEMSEGSHDMEMGEGAMTMRQMTDGLALVGGETVSFEPGSYHVMMPELSEPLEIGDEFDLTLAFAKADDVVVTVVVAETAP